MGANEIFQRAVDDIFDHLGIDVVYTPNGGDPAEIKANVEYGENLEASGRMIGARASAVLEVKASDVPQPGYKDTVLINGETWHVLRRISGDGFTWKLEIEGDVRVSFKE